MQRHAFALSIRKGCFNDFRSNYGKIWNDLTHLLDELHIENFSLWNIEDLVFGYYETDDLGFKLSEAQKKDYQAILAGLGDTFEWISSPAEEMRLMYHDFGIVRPNKELIRHRVFATRLKGNFQEEYKRRHDALVEARGGVPDPGPDSNFSIWNAKDYIFGYDEIDVTMEKEETEQDRQGTIAWETKMLEIMEWYTDDVDWITDLHHRHVVRIGYHN